MTELIATCGNQPEVPDHSHNRADLYHQLPEAHAVALVGPPMSGKTDTVLQMAREALESGPVIYAALEEGKAALCARMRNIGAEPEDFTILDQVPRITYTHNEAGAIEVFNYFLAEMRAALVVIDSLAYVRSKADDDDIIEANLKALASLEALATTQNVRVVIVHHIKNLADVARFPEVVKAILYQRNGIAEWMDP